MLGAMPLQLIDMPNDEPGREPRRFLSEPDDAMGAHPNLMHLVRLYEADRELSVASRVDAETLLMHPSYSPGAPAGWMMHLPWEKNPIPMNAKSNGHWSTKAKAVAFVRQAAWALALNRIKPQERIRVRLDWETVTKRTRDEDNVVACMKALVDGLRSAAVVPDDDRRYVVREMPVIRHEPKSEARPKAYMRFWILKEPNPSTAKD